MDAKKNTKKMADNRFNLKMQLRMLINKKTSSGFWFTPRNS